MTERKQRSVRWKGVCGLCGNCNSPSLSCAFLYVCVCACVRVRVCPDKHYPLPFYFSYVAPEQVVGLVHCPGL
ncbi:hypothetical protein DPEC_G00153490 [Dallia pectoralis]|uniref:Uncharacterized protein n=1 Tax=Dallia pectoralis TaxID=75939 RepID=A0ACC2GJI4_DALPE|nr:hypothetical protein DPEC_G00153490 [Dallia pectoralis]